MILVKRKRTKKKKRKRKRKTKKKRKKKKKKSKAEIDDYIFTKKLQDETERLPSPLGQEIAYENENEFGDENEDNKSKNAFKKTNCVDITFEINKEKNDYPSAINISALSDKKLEEERLFPAFSFFKIKKVILKDGTKENPHQIILEVIHKKYNLEERMVKGERVYLDSQTNLLMTRKFINE